MGASVHVFLKSTGKHTWKRAGAESVLLWSEPCVFLPVVLLPREQESGRWKTRESNFLSLQFLSLLPEKSLTGFQLMGKANLPSAVSRPFCIRLGSRVLPTYCIPQGCLPPFFPSRTPLHKVTLPELGKTHGKNLPW